MPKSAFVDIQDVPDFIGAPDTIRTCDLCLRRGNTPRNGDLSDAYVGSKHASVPGLQVIKNHPYTEGSGKEGCRAMFTPAYTPAGFLKGTVGQILL
jgi:hypothetical protein